MIVSKIALHAQIAEDPFENHENVLIKSSGNELFRICCSNIPFTQSNCFADLTTILNIFGFPMANAGNHLLQNLDASQDNFSVPEAPKTNLVTVQADMFTSLIFDMYKRKITDITTVHPCFSGLLQCLKAGWRPLLLQKVTLVYIFSVLIIYALH